MKRIGTTRQDDGVSPIASPSKSVFQVRRLPRLIPPAVEQDIKKTKRVKRRQEWNEGDAMPVLEKMDWNGPPSETRTKDAHADNLVWKWFRRSGGGPPVGRWVNEEEGGGAIHADYEEEPTQEPAEEKWTTRARERRKMMAIERGRGRLTTNSSLFANGNTSHESIDYGESSTQEYKEDPDSTKVEEEVVDVVEDAVDALPLSSFPSTQGWTPLYHEHSHSSPPDAFEPKDARFDPIAMAALHRSRKNALRQTKLEKKKETEKKKLQLRLEREAKLRIEAREIEEEKRKRAAVDEQTESKRAKRADYVRRLRAEKRMEMGEEEWEKHLEREREKRRHREHNKMLTPGYIEKKRLRQTLKTREIRLKAATYGLQPMHFQREEEVYEDGVYEMEETTDNNQGKDESLNTGTEDEEIEVEKW